MTYENAVQRLVREHAAKMAAKEAIDGKSNPIAPAHGGATLPVGEATEIRLDAWFSAITPSSWSLQE